MALPTLSKTWRYRVNESLPASASQAINMASVVIAMLNGLLGGGSWTDSTGAASAVVNPWTVVSSNGRVTGVTVGSNVLTTSAEVVWASSGNRFWIILQNVDGVQLLIASPNTLTAQPLVVSFSVGGLFTGGTATTLPTATDQVTLDLAYFSTSNNTNRRIHFLHSTDGRATRIFICEAGSCTTSVFLGRLTSAKAGLANPFYINWSGLQGATASVSNNPITGAGGHHNASSANCWVRHASTSVRTFFGSLGSGSGLQNVGTSVPDEFESAPDQWALDPIVLCGASTVGGRGRAGLVNDIWVGSAGLTTGDQYPLSGGRTFTQFVDLVVPWNTTLVLIT